MTAQVAKSLRMYEFSPDMYQHVRQGIDGNYFTLSLIGCVYLWRLNYIASRKRCHISTVAE